MNYAPLNIRKRILINKSIDKRNIQGFHGSAKTIKYVLNNILCMYIIIIITEYSVNGKD